MYCSIERIKAIAEAVAREEHDDLVIVGVTPGEARRGHAEIVVVRRRVDAEPYIMAIGVDRNRSEARLREQISSQLRFDETHSAFADQDQATDAENGAWKRV